MYQGSGKRERTSETPIDRNMHLTTPYLLSIMTTARQPKAHTHLDASPRFLFLYCTNDYLQLNRLGVHQHHNQHHCDESQPAPTASMHHDSQRTLHTYTPLDGSLRHHHQRSTQRKKLETPWYLEPLVGCL